MGIIPFDNSPFLITHILYSIIKNSIVQIVTKSFRYLLMIKNPLPYPPLSPSNSDPHPQNLGFSPEAHVI